jgi:hypothetical protein
MKAIFATILACLILFFSAGFKIATHYCGDVAVSSVLTTNGVAEGCGMEAENAKDCNSESPSASKKNCCNDDIVNLEIEDDYQPNEKGDYSVNVAFVQAYVYVFIHNLFDESREISFKDYSPPIVQHDILVEQQTFLI